MMTQTHLLLACGLLARRGERSGNRLVVAGALVPDLAIFVLFGWAAYQGIPQATLWDEIYWQPSWQAVFAVGNSVPVFTLLLALGLWRALRRDRPRPWRAPLVLFSAAALIHLAGDFPLHNSDAHQHFWPLTDWRWASPFSYWDREHYGGFIAPLEGLLGIALAGLLFRRFKAVWIRLILAVTILAYIAVPAFFILSLGATS